MQEKTRTDIQPKKRTYLRPEVRFERVFETMALSCGKLAGGGPGNCGGKHTNTKTS